MTAPARKTRWSASPQSSATAYAIGGFSRHLWAIDGERPTSRAVWDGPAITDSGLSEAVTCAASVFGLEGVLVVYPRLADAWGIPPKRPAAGQPLPAPLDLPVRDGWSRAEKDGSAWITYYRGRGQSEKRVLVLIAEWARGQGDGWFFDPAQFPLAIGTHQKLTEITGRLALWHQRTGAAWAGPPQLAAANSVRTRYWGKPPMFRPPDVGEWANLACEMPITRGQWNAPVPAGAGWVHEYDGNTAYLAAASGTVLARDALTHTGPVADAERVGAEKDGLAGLFCCVLAPWTDPRIPAPWGAFTPGEGEVVALAAPTVALLVQLCADGVYGGLEIVDSWSAPGSRVLRDWSEAMTGVIWGLTTKPRCPELEPAARAMVPKMWGMLGKKDNPRLYRPDWSASVIAQGRVTLWRRMWFNGTGRGFWPLDVNTDAVCYASPFEAPDHPDGPMSYRPGEQKAAGTAFFLGSGNSFYKVKSTWSAEQWEAEQ